MFWKHTPDDCRSHVEAKCVFSVVQCNNHRSWLHVGKFTAPKICAKYHLVHSKRDSIAINVYDMTIKFSYSKERLHANRTSNLSSVLLV